MPSRALVTGWSTPRALFSHVKPRVTGATLSRTAQAEPTIADPRLARTSFARPAVLIDFSRPRVTGAELSRSGASATAVPVIPRAIIEHARPRLQVSARRVVGTGFAVRQVSARTARAAPAAIVAARRIRRAISAVRPRLIAQYVRAVATQVALDLPGAIRGFFRDRVSIEEQLAKEMDRALEDTAVMVDTPVLEVRYVRQFFDAFTLDDEADLEDLTHDVQTYKQNVLNLEETLAFLVSRDLSDAAVLTDNIHIRFIDGARALNGRPLNTGPLGG